jgi:hypothetical protein
MINGALAEIRSAPLRRDEDLRRILLGLWGRLSAPQRETLIAQAHAIFKEGQERKKA